MAAGLRAVLKGQLEAIAKAGTWKNERILTSAQGSKISVGGRPKKVLNFCANNYLGLANNRTVVEAAKSALDSHGNGLSSVRFICGTQDIHKELETTIAKFHGMEDAILYASCFDANAGIFEALLSAEDAVISDELNHASIIDGVRLCKAQKARYKHRDIVDLERCLGEAQAARARLIVTDGVFSMDGTVAPLPKILALADKYNASVLIDECHATGFFGATGRGTPEATNAQPHIINSTLGKALGGAVGGYTTGPREVIAMLRQRSRPYLFSNTLPPAVVGASITVFDLLNTNADLPQKVLSNTKRFREGMAKTGLTVGGDPQHPICPVMLGDARLAAEFADAMLDHDIYVIGFSYPVVPVGKARIRVQISAAHEPEDIDRCVAAFAAVAKAKGVVA
eukprot:m.231546 g.231546  ORF g.231546 m.231546 type:complete len:397 (-) comp18401_c0_seq1:69-1259(-)